MRLKFLSLFAAGLLLAACETTSTEGGGGAGGTAGGGAGGTGGATGGGVATSGPGSASDFISVGDRVFFDFDSSVIKIEARETLQAQAAWLNQFSNVSVTIEGHADERGTREYNLALGERRATAAKNYMVSLGVTPGRVSTISYGKERPAVIGSTEAAYAQNRRAVTIINQ